MNGAVHYGHTRRWALDEGFSAHDAEVIARSDIAVDRLHPVGYWPTNWGWHYAVAGANRKARELLRQAVFSGDLVLLGEALHCRQDAITHGWLGPIGHWPGIDIWERRSQRIRDRIERASRELLSAYVRERPLAEGTARPEGV